MEQSIRRTDSATVRRAAICGMMAPITLTSAIFIAGALRPGYNHVMQYISALGELGDTSSYVMNFGGFFLFGALLMIFAFGFFHRIALKELSEMNSYVETLTLMAPILIVFAAVGYMAAAFWTGVDATLHGVAGAFAMWVFSLPLITIFTFRNDSRWRSIWMISLVIFISQVIIGLTFKLSSSDMIGLAQRMGYVPTLIWVESVSIKLYRLA
jgi:hypothetical membrane protein